MRQLKYWLPALLYMGLIFWLSSRPRVQVSEVFLIQFAVFKTLHVIEYAILYLLLYRVLRNTRKAFVWQNLLDVWLIALVYAMTDEIHQVFIPTREGRMRDIAIDAVGISLAAIYLWKYLPKAPRKLKSWAKKLEFY